MAFAGAALAVVLCGALAAQYMTGERLKRRIGQEMATLAGQVRTVLDTSMYDRWRDVHILAAAARTAAPTAETRRAWVEIMRRTFPDYAWIGFADSAGTVTASTDRLLEGISVAARPWFKGGLSTGFVGDLHEAVLLAKHLEPPADGSPWRFIDIAAPVFTEDGQPEGVVGAHLSWTWADRLTHSVLDTVIAQSPGTDVLVIDQAGTVILGPDNLQGEKLRRSATGWRRTELGGSYTLETWPDHATYLVGESRTVGKNDYPGLGWTVLVRRNADLAFAPAGRLARELMLGGIVLAGIAALFGCGIARRIGNPLLALADAADTLKRQSMPLGLPYVGGTNEVWRLFQALNGMLAALAQRDASLAEANAGLERRIAERTHELEVMRDKADAASISKTRFLATMSHELRTPLNGILGYVQLLQLEGGLNPAQSGRLDAMLGAGQHLREMISRVLDMSAVEAGRTDLKMSPVFPEQVAASCLDVVRPTAEAGGLRFTLHTDPEAPTILTTDPQRLRQILLNLIGNAVKFTRQGSVDVRLLASADGGLRAEVADTGPGISVEHRAGLFRDFERFDTDAASIEGSGLGLALSARLAMLLGGRLGYDDNPGGGSIFWLELPLAPADAEATAPTSDDAPAPPARRLRVLLVDDVAMNRDIARSFLGAAGHDVSSAKGGIEAVEIATQADFDVVLMDVCMPDIDGLEATRRIRALPGLRGQVPIVAVTAQAFAEQRDECRRAGMAHHLVKPYSVAELQAVVLRAARPDAADERLPEHKASSCGNVPEGDVPASDQAESNQAGSDLPVLDDRTFAKTASFLDAQGVQECLQGIAARADALLQLLQTRTGPDDRDQSRARAAHTLVGSAGMFGFQRVCMLARQFEQAVHDGLPEIEDVASALAVAITALLQRIAELTQEPAPPDRLEVLPA